MKNDPLALYKKFHSDIEFERKGLFVALKDKFSISSVLYPGSSVHITPSFFFPKVVYVDSYKQAPSFFKQPEVLEFIKENKEYSEESIVVFHYSDYYKDFGEKEKSFDMLFSQWAGFISQACKKYLKVGGILVVNNSHGDASMAHIDKDYEFVAVYNKKTDDNFSISEKDLEKYFIPKKDIEITKEYLEKTQKGVGYTKSPSGYIFKKLR